MQLTLLVKHHYITLSQRVTVSLSQKALTLSTSDGLGDTAIALLKAGAETDKKDVDGFLAMELAPDAQVG